MVQQRKSWLAHPRIRTMTGIVAKNAIEDLLKCGYICTNYVIMGEEGYHGRYSLCKQLYRRCISLALIVLMLQKPAHL